MSIEHIKEYVARKLLKHFSVTNDYTGPVEYFNGQMLGQLEKLTRLSLTRSYSVKSVACVSVRMVEKTIPKNLFSTIGLLIMKRYPLYGNVQILYNYLAGESLIFCSTMKCL